MANVRRRDGLLNSSRAESFGRGIPGYFAASQVPHALAASFSPYKNPVALLLLIQELLHQLAAKMYKPLAFPL